MENTEQATLVFKDQAGEYYLLPQVMLERGRVPAEAKTALEARVPALRALDTAGDDAQGHYAFAAGVLVGGAAAIITGVIALSGNDPLYPVIRRYFPDA